MLREFIAAPSAGRHRDRARPERSAARNVARRIANDVDLGRGELPAMLLFCASASEPPQLVAIPVIIGKRAKFKKMPDAVVLEFQSRAARDISSEKPEHYMRPRFELFEQFEHAREQFAFPARQFQ